MNGPEIDGPAAERILVGFIRDEVGKVGFSKAVLGVSGGIDSATVACLAARALGGANVLGVLMPYKGSSPRSLEDGLSVVRATGIQHRIIEITASVDAYFAAFPDASPLRRGNKMARERMSILYDQSAAWDGLVIGTSNKTELLLGYGTLYGDMACALNPIGDLYKSQLRSLARHLAVPEPVIAKPPTADLWSGQTDEDELGFRYAEVDALLYEMVDERLPDSELVEKGFAEPFVSKVRRMLLNSQYKRKLPIIAKLSSRTIDRDFRYSRDWGK